MSIRNKVRNIFFDDEGFPRIFATVRSFLASLAIFMIPLISALYFLFGDFLRSNINERKQLEAAIRTRLTRISELESEIAFARVSLDKSSDDISAWSLLTEAQNVNVKIRM